VRTWIDAGASDWSVGSFQTIAPFVTLTTPNGGELLRRGLNYFIKWRDNIPENVVLELYKSGVFVRTISTNAPSSGAFQWQVPLSLSPGNDYSIKITSTTNAAMADVSDAPFNIDAPSIDTRSLAHLADGRFRFAFTAFGSTQAVVSASSNLVFWEDLGIVTLTNGNATFTDNSSSNFLARFYRVHLP
jgi:hypothetical protein